MPAPLSPDLRRRFEALVLSGLNGAEAVRRLMVLPATGARPARKVRDGALLRPQKCGRPLGWGKLGLHKELLSELVEHNPDIALAELCGALADAEAVRVSQGARCRALRRMGFTFKKSRWSRMSGAVPMSPARGGTGSATAGLCCARRRSGWSSSTRPP